MLRKQNDLTLMIALTLMAVITIPFLGSSVPVLRAALGLAFVLIVPGYALTAAIFHDGAQVNLERILYILGLSFFIDIVMGLFNNLMPWGIKPLPWLLSVAIVSLMIIAVAWKQRGIGIQKEISPPVNRIRFRQVILFLSAAFLMVAAVVFMSQPNLAHGVQGYSFLWLLPNKADPKSCPSIGVQSFEFQTVKYRLQLLADGKPVEEENFTLKPGEKWENSCKWSTTIANSKFLEANLFREDMPNDLFRKVFIWR